jgi:3-oxoacyl-(acyl-carrier-protein) synthase/SAM-dependent methyltransferase
LRDAVSQIKNIHRRIDGAIFSAMASGAEESIDQTTEARFWSNLEVKTLGSQAFYAALRDEPLDFMCFFSSGQAYSFSGAARLAGYATGITFSDSFVRSIRPASRFPVGTINWGFWAAGLRERLGKFGGVSTTSIDALEDAEAFECCDKFVRELGQGRLHQVLCMRASPEVERLMNCSRRESVALVGGERVSPAMLAEAASNALSLERVGELVTAEQQSGLNDWFARLLFCQLDRLIELGGVGLPKTVTDLRRRSALLDKYEPWLRQSLRMLAAAGLIEMDGDVIHRWHSPDRAAAWSGWRRAMTAFEHDPDCKALVVLINECLEKLPDILQGKILATDVIFPRGSMAKVEEVYKNNAVARVFNEIVASAVHAYVRERLRVQPNTRVRILEVGAGTGGTSAAVFRKLEPYREAIEQYCYTDVSKAFFFHAEQNYVASNPYVVCRRLDIEQPIEDQGIDVGSYDVVISTNALHATKDVRKTLRHVKAALRKDGFAIISEMCERTLATHVTFGLLDGWWLFEDAELRIPGCPGLYPESWQRVLQDEGFSSVLLPASEARALGNQVIVAQSDGVIRLGLRAAASAVGEPNRPSQRVASRPPSQDVAADVRAGVLDCLSATLKMPADAVALDIAFSDYGVDSILGVNFINRLNERLGISLNTAVVFEYSSAERLSGHIVEAYRGQIDRASSTAAADEACGDAETAAEAQGEDTRVTRATRVLSEIAIIGMSGQFPKAGNVDQFWRNLVDGVDGVQEFPAHYLDQANAYSATKQRGKTRCKWGGILADRDCFDPLFFNISPREAESMNPHQRLVMQESWNALEDAGYNPKTLSGSHTAIFIGAEPTGYVGDTFTGLSDALIASRLSYALNFSGPAFVVNTGCSSSAVAIHLACESLRNGESQLVLAGGVNACLHQEIMVRLDQIDMLSSSGRCCTFDEAGDGTVISEGVGMLVLKRLDDAIADGDAIYATICGSGMNQDGASNGITAPNGAAQERLICGVYDRFGIDPERISYVEAHGTGTKLGDPVEANALVRAFRRYSAKTGWCAVGSAKSHIGHTAAAAGVISVIKVLLSMQHQQVPRLLNFSSLNPLIEFEGSPFCIARETSDYRSVPGAPRMAAINSFGHSGTNVHLVVREHQDTDRDDRSTQQHTGELAIPLSARTAEQLRQKCEDLVSFLGRQNGTVDLRPVAYTLQVGRESMAERVGVVADSVDALVRRLRAFLDGESTIEGVVSGRAAPNSETIVPRGSESAAALIDLWARGHSIDWKRLWDGPARGARVRLPGYPFAKERYWMASAFGEKRRSDNTASEPVTDQRIENILNRIVDDTIGAAEGAELLTAAL